MWNESDSVLWYLFCMKRAQLSNLLCVFSQVDTTESIYLISQFTCPYKLLIWHIKWWFARIFQLFYRYYSAYLMFSFLSEWLFPLGTLGGDSGHVSIMYHQEASWCLLEELVHQRSCVWLRSKSWKSSPLEDDTSDGVSMNSLPCISRLMNILAFTNTFPQTLLSLHIGICNGFFLGTLYLWT